MVDVGINPMLPRVIWKEVCLHVLNPSGLSKDPIPRRCISIFFLNAKKNQGNL